ncbi:MAG: MEDS domain-containing protein [Thermoproteota archaeon]|nr:MEDS domain-containing protein [Thermoproteota archaeon]
MRVNNRDSENNELIKKWFKEEIAEGENGIIIYPNLQTFRQIYTQYVKDQLSKEEDEENNSTRNKQLKPRIILIATFYETIDSVKHNLNAIGVVDLQRYIDNGSLVIVDAFSSYYPDINGMKKLVASLSQRARREGRVGVSSIVDMGYFFLFGGDGRATELINYEASLPPKTKGGNVRGFSCYHRGNYDTLKDSQRKELAQKGKKVLEVTESTY